MAKQIAIIGTAESCLLANELDNTWQIWTCNGAYDRIKRQDKHFELHDIGYLRSINVIPEYLEWFKTQGSRVVLQKKYDEFPECEVYPLKEIINTLGHAYFNNTIAYMIAYAMHTNPDLERIAIYGVDMAADSEYRHQRPCCEFWIGYGISKGIIFDIPDICPLLKSTHLYAFEEMSPLALSLQKRATDTAKILKEKEEAKNRAAYEFYFFKGASEVLEKQKSLFL